ncbi:4-coumarate--CoA ligase 1-like [Rhagoletis pomonella]|uniref:4-coumarate--CoA ligase 1-like n=1 Tax=Rhagoletis pomonella TaxID=28610 RepID=UPI001786CB17|nr:4-coumarate--CoA ligase 1-like [Rhagoletis pomonella]
MNSLECSYDEKERIWCNAIQSPTYDFNCSLGKIIYNNLKNFPKKICQVSDIDGLEVTNAEMLSWSIRLARHFKKLGLRHNNVIGIVAKNSTYTSAVAVGCFMNCTPFHAVNGGLDADTIQQLFENTAPKIIFCDGDVYEKIHGATRSLRPLLYTLTNHIDGVAKVEDLLVPTPNEDLYLPEPLMLGGAQTVAILCSSGTTGVPKCVCLSNYYLQFENMFVTSEDVVFTNSSLDWVTGLIFTYLSTSISCKRVITNRPYTPEYLVDLVKKYKITYIGIAPRHVATLVACPTATAENLSSVNACLVGGGCISLPTMKRLQSILKNCAVTFGYGLTEVGLVSINSGEHTPSSVGKLFPGLKVRIVDEDGQNLPRNEIGEVYVNTGRTWNGYYGNPSETQRTQDSSGWFHTGDLGYFDDNNLLYIVDRKKDIIKYQGMHYWPAEIEQVINELAEVEDVCVVGVYDERNGDAAGAVVVRRKGAQLTEQQVKEHVRKRLPVYYKQLHAGVVFIERLPQNSNGKTLRREAKVLLEAK